MLISLSKLCVEALRKCSTWLSHHACVEVTIASDVRGRHVAWYITLKRTLTTHKWHTITDTESKTSLNIPIKLTDADQILHISVTDLSLTPPTSSDKIIQRYTLYEWYNTIRASTSTCRGSDTRQSFLTTSFLKWRHECGYILPIKRVANRMPIIVLYEKLVMRRQ
jgi:hypothetical protein